MLSPFFMPKELLKLAQNLWYAKHCKNDTKLTIDRRGELQFVSTILSSLRSVNIIDKICQH